VSALGGRMTNDEIVRLYARDQERRGLLKSTVEKRKLTLRTWERWIARPFGEAKREDVEAFLDRRNLGARARYAWISHLHCFYEWAVAEELVSLDPTAKIIRPKLRRALPRPASSKELARALKNSTPRQRCWILLAAYQGLRCQEICGLRREDVLEAEGLLRVVHGKGGHERLLPLHPAVYEALRSLPMPRQGWVFTAPMGGKYNPQYISVNFNRALRDLGVEATAHQLRHWFGSNLYAQTHDLRVVQEMMGHASPTTTSIYTAFDKQTAIEGICGLSLDTDDPEAA
jgi:site-specific recombinase XerD